MKSNDGITEDTLFDGKLRIAQPGRGFGYRVNVDALILAAFATRGSRHRVAFDLGSGVGSVGLTLLFTGAATRVIFVEKDGAVAKLAERNVETNGFIGRGEVIHDDVRKVAASHQGLANLVVCNPPYFDQSRGRLPSAHHADARFGAVRNFIVAAGELMGKRARACFIYPASELARFLVELREAGVEPKRIRFVHPKEGTPARVFLVEVQRAKPGGLTVDPPLIERSHEGLSTEMSRIVTRGLPLHSP